MLLILIQRMRSLLSPSSAVYKFTNTCENSFVTAALKKITDDLLKLPAEDRMSVADALIASVPELEDVPLHEAWEKELDKRIDAYERGEAETLSSDESHARALRMLNEARRSSGNRNA